MKFNFENLDQTIRQLMINEMDFDIQNNKLYLSKRFNDNGQEKYEDLLKQSLESGDEQTLAVSLKNNNCFKSQEERKTKTGTSLVKVPENANITFAEGEFNRFYIRALCLKAIDENLVLEVYRARHSDKTRSESENLIGEIVDPQNLLNDLRENIGIDTALGLPPGPNSGLSIKVKL
ncbi:hypothetical protein [Chryseobacterium turcicum]|uniref:Uncharacterized protein n=1 Tax=Chryseobacterium turcicum TaxID=2898076 RepID=A0A9Q3V5V7_9FLAO|nr:hypothetical protein [Chryseobacterium turcicum]MCD1117891.1 hypothetical protein [Chryseobacterium turcicum]